MLTRAKAPARWAKMLSDVSAGWPWPYSQSEAEAIAAALPDESSRQPALSAVIAEARRFLAPPAVAARSVSIKPNPAAQIRRLALAVQEVKNALEGLDFDAIQHLQATAILDDNRPLPYFLATYAFELNAGLANPPVDTNTRGRRPNLHLGALQVRIKTIWITAHNGAPPKQGWPKFRDACLNPIDPAPPADSKTREDQLSAAKDRNN